MSSKFLKGFSEESSELQKQIGCMTGIFQMFDRHNLLGGKRFNGHHNHNLPSGNSLVDVSNPGVDNVACSPRLFIEKNVSKSLSENQRISMESSRTSFSSSSCSSFSSVDCSKSTPQQPVTFTQAMNNLPNTKCSEIDAKSAQRFIDFQKVAKEPTNGEPYNSSLSMQTSRKEGDFKQHVSCRDSPRPMQLSKSMDGSYVIGIDGKSRSSLDINESFRVLMKLKESPWSFSKIVEPSFEAKEAPFNQMSRDDRRLSYDGRDILSNFLDSRENIRPSKLKELPRLSLDSRESSMRSCNSLVKDLNGGSINKERSFTSPNTQIEMGSQKSAPSVVAKLMGLESMPNSSLTLMESVDVMRNYPIEKPNGYKQQRGNKNLNDSFHSSKEARPSNTFSTVRASIEPAPWKQKEMFHVPQDTISRRESKMKQRPETVYSEIEKRLNEIEFRHANKDLRALKQILDAMQAKGLLESKKREEQRSPKSVCNVSNHQVSNMSAIARRPPLPSPNKGSNTTKTYESPIVIMKPAKSLDIFDVSPTSVIPLHGLSKLTMLRTNDKKKLPGSSKLARDSTQRTSPRINGKTEENGQRGRLRAEVDSSNKLLQQSSKEINRGIEKSSNSVSPRLQQRKTEVERRIHSSISSDSNKHQKLSSNKQLSESISPRNKLRRRSTKVRGNDDQESKESRNVSLQGDVISHGSDSNISSASQLDMHDISSNMHISSSKQGVQNLSTYLVLKQMYSPIAPEQPSPVSVLNATFYQDDLLASDMMRNPNNPKGIKLSNSYNSCESHHMSSKIDQTKFESIGNVLQNLEERNLTGENTSTTEDIAPLCKSQSRDHRYISEIMLASGLLKKDLHSSPSGLMPIQLHPSGHPINPDLFLVLEQTKVSQVLNFDPEKSHRKLLFDLVNEFLVQKLEDRCSNSHRKLEESTPSGKQLLKDLCSEIDRIQNETSKSEGPNDDGDIIYDKTLYKSLKWNDFNSGLPSIVLDIERSIFKDLIDEIVDGEASSLKQKCSRRRRQLFAK